MPEYQVFLTDDRMDKLWGYVKYFLFYVSPLVMISAAILTVGMVIWALSYYYNKVKDDKNDDDDDYEVYRY